MRKHTTYRRLVTGIVTVVMLLSGLAGYTPVAAQDNCTPNANNEVADGCTLPAGTLALWEGSAHPSTWLYAGYIPDGGFTVNRASGLNAWAGFDSFEAALDGACKTAEDRYTVHGYTAVYVNDQLKGSNAECMALEPYGNAPSSSNSSSENDSGDEDSPVNRLGADLRPETTPVSSDQEEQPDDGLGTNSDMTVDPGFYTQEQLDRYGIVCRPALGFAQPGDPAPAQGSIYDNEPRTEVPDLADSVGTGLAVPPPECISEGIVVVRAVVYGPGAWEDVSVYVLEGDNRVVCGKQGTSIAYDCWESYPSVDRAMFDACNQALGDRWLIDTPGSYLYRGTLTYMGGELPAACE